MAYNEETFLQYMIDHYKQRFPNCNIVLFDNESTDNTKKIALSNKCEVIDFNTNNQIDDEKIRILKNNCWKDAKTDWVLVCDIDELLDISDEDLIKESNNNSTIILSEAYTLVNMQEDFNFSEIKFGIRDKAYDKAYLFNKKYITSVNYNHGCHVCSPQGTIKYSDIKYKLYHYKYLNINYHIKRNAYTYNRLSELNKKQGWGIQWHVTDQQIKNMFEELRVNAQRIIK